MPHKKVNERKDFTRLYQKTGWTNFDELRVTDSTLNEGINSRVTSELGKERWFCWAW